jgi:hypothetical protein
LLTFSSARSRLRIDAGPPVSNATQDVHGYALEALKKYYNCNIQRVHHILEREPPSNSDCLRSSATYYEYILLDGRRISPLQRTLRKTAGSSIVKVVIAGQRFCGVVRSFFRHDQPLIHDDTLWAEMDWMEDQDLSPVEDDPWSD